MTQVSHAALRCTLICDTVLGDQLVSSVLLIVQPVLRSATAMYVLQLVAMEAWGRQE